MDNLKTLFYLFLVCLLAQGSNAQDQTLNIALCEELDDIENGRIEYSPDTIAPYDVMTVATYICDEGFRLIEGNETRACEDMGDGLGAEFDGMAPECIRVEIMFDKAVYTYGEGDRTAYLDIVANIEVNFRIFFSYRTKLVNDEFIAESGRVNDIRLGFALSRSVSRNGFFIANDNIGLEDVERHVIDLTVSPDFEAAGVFVGAQNRTEIHIIDDDVVFAGFEEDLVTVGENAGVVRICVRQNIVAVRDVTITFETVDGTALDGSDYSVPNAVIIGAGGTQACFFGAIIDDNLAGEGKENFTLKISSVSPSEVTVTKETMKVVIVDDDDGTCDPVGEIHNGMISYSVSDAAQRFPISTIVTYTCNDGYYLMGGDSERVCEVLTGAANGTFSGQDPECIPLCEELDEIENGRIEYKADTTAPYDVMTVATYICDEGFTLIDGNETRVCEDNCDGTGADFNGTAPECVAFCPALPDVDNAVIIYSDDTIFVGTVATYECQTGYMLVGNRTRVCQSDGKFSLNEPRCIEFAIIECDELEPPENGGIRYSRGSRGGPPYSVGTFANYRCNFRYRLIGSVVRVCRENGEFDREPPTCERVTCNQLTRSLENGMITYSPNPTGPYFVGARAIHTCDPGYNLFGPSALVCRNSGRFSSSQITCEPDCPPLPELPNAVITYTPDPHPFFKQGSLAQYECLPGYMLIGNNGTRRCQRDGTYTGRAPMCVSLSLECDDLEPLVNGVITYSPDTTAPYSVGTSATHTCNPGYQLVGTTVRVCGDDGEFDRTPPTCESFCPALPDVDNAIITYSDVTIIVGTVATYECQPGYMLVGNRTRVCQSDGKFSLNEPRCIEFANNECDELEPPENGRITYDRGSSGGPPYSVGTTANYRCNFGYSLVGPVVRVCRENGEFDREPPTCERVTCDQLTRPLENGMITYYPNTTGPNFVGARAIITCNPGYNLFGPPAWVCTFFGSNSARFSRHSLTTCEPDCPPLPELPNAVIEYIPDTSPRYRQGYLVKYECVPGYMLIGNNGTRKCQKDGTYTGQAPMCVSLSLECDELEPLVNGVITYSPDTTAPYSEGTNATHTCNPGYRLVGTTVRVCGDGEFDSTPPTCERIDMVECEVNEPMMVSPFSRDTSYTFMGSCERVLLRSCDESVDFSVRTDFITDSMENGAVGVFIGESSWIISENGGFDSSEEPDQVETIGDAEHQLFDASDVTVLFAAGFSGSEAISIISISVGDGIGATVTYTFTDPPSISVTVSSGSSLGETCGLCGTEQGVLRLPDGSVADITDRAQVEAFTMSYLTPAHQQSLRPVRRECSEIRNDTIVGAPVFTAALTTKNGGPDNLCYEVRGSANHVYNLVSDECVSVNALYAPMDQPEFGNIMTIIGIRAATTDGRCYEISVNREGCTAFVSRQLSATMINSTFESGGISVRRYPNRVRIAAPNCDQVTLVMWVRCVTRGGQDMLDFAVSRGANLRATSHGLLGQFWNVPVSSTPAAKGVYSVTVTPPSSVSTPRTFHALPYSLTWDNRFEQCLYAGNAQGGSYNELQDASMPSDSVIQGGYRDYRTGGLFQTSWKYSRFQDKVCPPSPVN